METLKKQTNIRGDVKETDKYSWRRESNGQIFVETLKIRDKYSWRRERNRQIFVETLKKQTNIHGDVKETEKYWWRR